MRTPKSKVFSIYLVVVLLRFWVKSRMCPNCCHPVPCEKNKKRRRSSWHFLFYIMRPRAVHLLVQEAKQAKCCGKTEKSAKILIRNFKNLKYIQMVYGFSISDRSCTHFCCFPKSKKIALFFQYLQHCGENQAFEVWNVKNSFFQLWREFMKGQKAFCHKNNLAKVHFFIKEQQILPGFVRCLVFSSKKNWSNK